MEGLQAKQHAWTNEHAERAAGEPRRLLLGGFLARTTGGKPLRLLRGRRLDLNMYKGSTPNSLTFSLCGCGQNAAFRDRSMARKVGVHDGRIPTAT